MLETTNPAIAYDPVSCKFVSHDDPKKRFSTFAEAQMHADAFRCMVDGKTDEVEHSSTWHIANTLRIFSENLQATGAQHRAISNAIERLEALA